MSASAGLSAPFIRRPIATLLLGVAALLGGALGYWMLPVSALPQVDFPTIQITTQLPGSSPDTTAFLITAPLERQLGQIPSLAVMTSTSSYGISNISLQFELNRDIDSAAEDVQAAINRAASTLPRALPYPPAYSKVNPADAPIVTLALTSDTTSLRDLSDLADTQLTPRLSEVSGVGRVSVAGSVRPAVRIQADFVRLANYGLALEDLRVAISNANVAGPKGSFDGAKQSYSIWTNDQITLADSYRSVVIANRNGTPVLLSDVANVVDGLENAKVSGSYQGRPAIIVNIQRQPGANVVQTVQRVLAELPRVHRAMPAGVKTTVVNDRTVTIRASVRDVQFALLVSIGLVVLIVLLFLRSIRATIIASVVLPLSLTATFGCMWMLGFSLDNLSLMALTVGTGFVIDDAIVIIENIFRHIEGGEQPLDAALRGAREIGFTVVSLTVSLIAVFIPLLFMPGLVGRMFREFALTLTTAVVISAIVSLTLTPMMSSRMLRQNAGSGSQITKWLNGWVDRTVEIYRRSLGWVIRHQTSTLAITAITLAATIWLYVTIPKGFLPPQDTGLITAVTEAGPEVSFAEMSRLQKLVTDAIKQDSDVTAAISEVGVSQLNPTSNVGHVTLALKPREEREASVIDVIERLQRSVASIPGIAVYLQPVQDIQISSRSSRARYQYTLTGADFREVRDWAEKLADLLRSETVLREITSDSQSPGLRTFIKVDRATAGRLGLSMQVISDTLYDAFGQRQISTIYAQANQYRVILEALPTYQQDSTSLSKLFVPSTNGSQIPLSAFATVEQITAPLSIGHQAQFPAVTISFNLARHAALSDAVAAITRTEHAIGMPPWIVGSYSGDVAEFTRSLAGEPWLILAATVTIYIVLGVLYESFFHPLTILSTLPSAGVGALLALMICRLDLSVVALIGLVLLMGIVKKNAIIMIDFAIVAERTEGLSPQAAIMKASLLRFRPIMMTTLAALFGALPLALENGIGSELRFPLGVTIIGGLLLSQLLTLYTTPVIYLAMERLRAALTRVDGRPNAIQPTPAPEYTSPPNC